MAYMTRKIRQRRIRQIQLLVLATLATVIFLPRMDLPDFGTMQLPGVTTVNAAEADAQ